MAKAFIVFSPGLNVFPFLISAPTDVRGGRREGVDRRVVRTDPGVRGLRPVSRHQLHVENLGKPLRIFMRRR